MKDNQVNDTTPNLSIMKPSQPRMRKWLRIKNNEAQILHQPKPVVEPYRPPFPFPNGLKMESGKVLNSSPCDITNDYVKNMQEIKDEDSEWEELELLLADEIDDLKGCLPKDSNKKLDPDKDLLELEYLMAHPGATLVAKMGEKAHEFDTSIQIIDEVPTLYKDFSLRNED